MGLCTVEEAKCRTVGKCVLRSLTYLITFQTIIIRPPKYLTSVVCNGSTKYIFEGTENTTIIRMPNNNLME
jgi:hypothetical protein